LFTDSAPLAPVNVIDKQAASAVIVIVCPFWINTTSPATGALNPGDPAGRSDHVEEAFQLPDATEYRSAAKTEDAEIKSKAAKIATRFGMATDILYVKLTAN
jgi:hypothetical protein